MNAGKVYSYKDKIVSVRRNKRIRGTTGKQSVDVLHATELGSWKSKDRNRHDHRWGRRGHGSGRPCNRMRGWFCGKRRVWLKR